MIEKIILDYLTEKLDVPVFVEIPNNPPDAFVLVEKTGSGRTNKINSATVAVQSYGASMYSAALLNEAVKNAMEEIVIVSDVSKSSLNSDYNFTDTTSKKYRYQAVFDLVHY